MHRMPIIGLIAGAALLLSACGASEPAASPEPDAGALTAVNVSETAGIPAAFLNYGVEQGFFEEQGLELTVDTSAGGAAAVPGLINGGLQFAGSNVVSAMLAAEQGLPVRIVAPSTFGTETEGEDFSAVLVAPDSPIQEPADLAGATIAVNTLENIGGVTITAALEEIGVDASTIEFVEIGFPDMLAALERGQIDAAWEIEPFVTVGLQAGNRAVLWPYVDAQPGLMIGSFLATEDYIAQNPEIIEAFRNGVRATAASVSDDPAAFRAALPSLSPLSPEAAEAIVLPVWEPEVDLESLTFLADQMLEQGLISEPLDPSAVVAD